MAIIKETFGQMADGTSVDLFTLKNKNGMEAKITTYGGTLVALLVPDKNGVMADVVLGYDTLEGFIKGSSFFGSLVGRHANRIEKGTFQLDGVTYQVAINDGNNHLHGGLCGFDKVVWQAEAEESEVGQVLKLTYFSKDMEENYPGNLQVEVHYVLTEDNGLMIDYKAVSDKKTVINLTNHAYFNLKGHGEGDVTQHVLTIHAEEFTEVDNECIPTGVIKAVANTPMDFTKPTTILEGLQSGFEQIVAGNGYDHNWILDAKGDLNQVCAEVFEPESGRVMEVYTTKPGVQFYSGNYISGQEVGKAGKVYPKWGGLCLETQYFPNALKHSHFPSPVFDKGQVYKHTTIYQFKVRN